MISYLHQNSIKCNNILGTNTNTHPGLFKNVVEICFSSVIEQCEEDCEEFFYPMQSL